MNSLLPYFVNLGLTIATECALALILKVRKIGDLVLILLINCVTNPLVNLIMNTFVFRLPPIGVWILLAALEASVVFAEYLFIKKAIQYPKPFLLSLALNAGSFAVGLIIMLIKI